MPYTNTAQSFGSVTRAFHWLTALLILTAIPLGIIANDLPYDSSDALAQKAQLFSLHKTVGIAAFVVASLRILWAMTQTHPAPLHPQRRAETALASLVHWLLYISMLAVPLTGWVHHAATTGFAPILWPLGQDLPLVPKSEQVAQIAAALHWVFTKLLIASVLLHIAGAVKHHLIDKDATLRRMLWGTTAPANLTPVQIHRLPLLAAVVIYALGAVVALSLTPNQPQPGQRAASTTTQSGGNWQVQDGTLAITVRQMGAEVTGQFATWQADITFDETAAPDAMGQVTVRIDTTSLSLGSVSDQAKGPDFLNTAAHSTATFTASLSRTETGDYAAIGTLDLAGAEAALTLPFTLAIDGNQATMRGETRLDRRDFAIGTKYPDESSVGFGVTITVDLTAQRMTP